MEYIIKDKMVYKKETCNTGKQIAIVETYHDLLYHTKLTYDQANNKVYAAIHDFKDVLQASFAEPIIFELEGVKQEVVPIYGVAQIDFVSEVPGNYTIRTINPSMRNGEVVIDV